MSTEIALTMELQAKSKQWVGDLFVKLFFYNNLILKFGLCH